MLKDAISGKEDGASAKRAFRNAGANIVDDGLGMTLMMMTNHLLERVKNLKGSGDNGEEGENV